MPRILVALATYNEIENLPGLVDEILRTLPTADILVVDDNSPDGTGKWCDAHSENDPRVKCLHRSAKQGLGSATLAAAQWAIDRGYDLFVTMDADWSHHPRHLAALIAGTKHADVVIGSRYVDGGEIEGWPLQRRIASRGINRLSQLLLRLPIHDLSGAFRAYRVAKLRELDFACIRATGYAYLEELIWHLARREATFTEIPITFHERRAGESKINVREAVAKLSTLSRLALRSKSNAGK